MSTIDRKDRSLYFVALEVGKPASSFTTLQFLFIAVFRDNQQGRLPLHAL